MSPPRSLADWVQHITRSQLPVLGQTLTQIATIDELMQSHTAELTRVVLSDPGMTTKVLRLANTAYINPTHNRINTVSRAVIVLGFKTIRSLSVATILLDHLLARSGSDILRQEIARAFHASVLARELSRVKKIKSVEDVFIAALLFRIGELSFWACESESAKKLHKAALKKSSDGPLEDEILGFRLRRLTAELAREWRINNTLLEALRSEGSSESALCVCLADAIAALPIYHADTDAELPKELLQQLIEFTGLNGDELLHLCAFARDCAVQSLTACGAPEVALLLSGVPTPKPAQTGSGEIDTDNGIADPTLQLAVMRELNAVAQAKPDVNLVLQLVLEGLHRGAGLQRCIVALLDPARTQISAKFVLEQPRSDLLTKFHFELRKAPVLHEVVTQQRTLWSARDGDEYGFGVVLKRAHAADCFIGPLTIGKKTVGVFYVDRLNAILTQDDLDTFTLFVTQAKLCLQNVSTP